MTDPVIHLASASARRREILTALNLPFSYAGVDIDESPHANENAAELVLRLAVAKAQAAGRQPEAVPVLGADTVVALGGRVFGKPQSEREALEMLACLSGRTHEVLTGVALVAGGDPRTTLSRTEVQFRDIDPDEARVYWQSGEPAGKAGAYAVQGLAGVFVRSLRGSYSGVVGLPVFETAALLKTVGLDVLAFSAAVETT